MSDPTGHNRNKCVFCRIADGTEENKIIHQNEKFVVFCDIKAAAANHFLIIPHQHISSVKSLPNDQVDMISEMVSLGGELMEGKCDDIRFGFHWPPFTSIGHLHLHAIGPQSEIGFIANLIFKPDSYWFVSPETATEWLQKNKS